jgi:hypothetical protein
VPKRPANAGSISHMLIADLLEAIGLPQAARPEERLRRET